MIQHCLEQDPIKRGDGPFAIVMAPTRELAQQIEKEAKVFSRSSKGFKTTIVVGGTNMSDQRSDLRQGVEVCVATPGRLIDHLHQGNTNLGRVSLVILDEADRMLDMGFEPQIREVMQNLPTPHQTLLFSATMPAEVEVRSIHWFPYDRVRRGERRFLRTLPGVSLRPSLAFNPRPRRLSTPTDAFQLHPAIALYGTTLSRSRRITSTNPSR